MTASEDPAGEPIEGLYARVEAEMPDATDKQKAKAFHRARLEADVPYRVRDLTTHLAWLIGIAILGALVIVKLVGG